MEDLLTPVSTAYKTSKAKEEDALVEVLKQPVVRNKATLQASTPEDGLEILRNEPSFEDLQSVLNYLVRDAPQKSSFHIDSPGPLAAQLIHILVSEILPNYWRILNERSSNSKPKSFSRRPERSLFLLCLRNLSGLNAILARSKALIQQSKEPQKNASGLNIVEILKDHTEVLEALLEGETFLSSAYKSMSGEPESRLRTVWHELVIVIAGGKLLNTSAEIISIINEASSQVKPSSWIGEGVEYSRWLARNIKQWASLLSQDASAPWKRISEIFSKSLHLGYSDAILEELLELLLGSDQDRVQFDALNSNAAVHEQRTILNSALRLLTTRYLVEQPQLDNPDWWKADASIISAGARYLSCVIAKEESRKDFLITWLTSVSGAGIGSHIGVRRAAIAALSDYKYDLEAVLEKSMQQFGDQLYIKHAPSLQQEVHTQVLLLSAGYVHRISPLKISMLVRSSIYLNAISNRLASSSNQARYLGMLVGETLSSLVEKPDKQMNFKMEELQSPESKWYKSLVTVKDSIGSLEPFKAGIITLAPKKTNAKIPTKPLVSQPGSSQGQSKIVAIEELDDSFEELEDDLVSYAKPDSDDDDSDDDPTLVQRNKPVAPVYIRDLITYLRDTENYDRQKLGLSTASTLIRRKSNFGTEVTAHAEELASILVGIQDKFDLENFQDMRLQAMIAVLLSEPSKMGKWFAKTFFNGDYSLAQRASILTVLSISARELGGFKDQTTSLSNSKAMATNTFPSKRLPGRLHKLYISDTQKTSLDPIDTISQQLSTTMIQPLAANLADEATGPNVLKVRTFSSRLAVEARRAPATTNTLSVIVADSFFFPLTGLFFAHLKAYGPKNVIFEPFLLSSYLKTLSLIMHAAGTSTLQLPQMTSEMWDLLLSLRMQAQGDKSVGEAVLFGFMTILEMNGDQRRLSETYGRELLDTQKWVDTYFQSMGQGSAEDDRARMLAAGVLYKIREVVEKYQALLVGDMSSF